MTLFLLLLVLLIAVLDWFALATGRQRLGYFTKPAVIVALFVWLWATADPLALVNTNASRLLWIALGLGFALVGDILLMLPQNYLLPGMLAFLAMHLTYIRGLWGIPDYSYAPAALLAVLVLPLPLRLTKILWRELRNSNRLALRLPVMVYVTALSLTLYAALSRFMDRNWLAQWCYLVSAGAFLLMVSDILLARREFLPDAKPRLLTVRITYHLGQISIIVAAAYHFLTMSQF